MTCSVSKLLEEVHYPRGAGLDWNSSRNNNEQFAAVGAPLALSTPARSGMGREVGGYSGGSDVQMNGLTPHQSQVLNLIRSYQGTEGMSFDELKKRLYGLNINMIRQAVDFLSNEGHIYSTVDEDHFKSTDAE